MNEQIQMAMPRFRVIAALPGPADFCLVLYAEGRRVSVYGLPDYCKAFKQAFQLADELQCQMKLLPMTAAELIAFLSIEPGNLVQNTSDDTEMRRLVVTACKETVVKSSHEAARADALDLLSKLGAVTA